MKLLGGLIPIEVVLAVVLGLASISVAAAQPLSLPPGTGQVVGEVANCNNSSEVPAANVAVGVVGGQPDITRTDSDGAFSITLAAGEYTIVATADDGSTVSRFSVPVMDGQLLDIGILDLNAGVTGCGFDADLPAAQLANEVSKLSTREALPTLSPSDTGG